MCLVCACSAPNFCGTEQRSVSATASFRKDFGHALARSNVTWLFLMGISERESLPKQTNNDEEPTSLRQKLQCVPLATEPGISFIILTPMKILQRNLNRSTFVVWELKGNVSVVCACSAPNSCGTEQRSVSATASFRKDVGHALARSNATWLFLMGIFEIDSLPKQTTKHRRHESKYHRRNSDSDSGRTGKDFPKHGAPGSILSGRKRWPLAVHVMMSSHFLNSEVSPHQISLQYPD